MYVSGMATNNRSFQKLEKSYRLGRKRFIFYYGVCGWGLPVGFFSSIATFFEKGPSRLSLGVFLFVVLLLGGWIFGAVIWSWIEKEYLAMKNNEMHRQRLAELEERVAELESIVPHPKDTGIKEI